MFLVLALVLGITVLWAGATPSTTDSKSLLGGWTASNACCTGTGMETCVAGYDPLYGHPCGGTVTNVCLNPHSNPDNTCGWSGLPNLCYWAGPPTPAPEPWNICDDTQDSACSG